jgi:hypothetical protein
MKAPQIDASEPDAPRELVPPPPGLYDQAI